MRLRFQLLLLALPFGVLIPAEQPAPTPDLDATLNQIERRISPATASEEEAILADLLVQKPAAWKAYDLYWRTLKMQRKETELRDSAIKALAAFDRVPRKKRMEESYFTALRASSILDDKDRKESITREAIERFPKGRIAGNRRFREAQAAGEKDPVAGASLYQALMNDYSRDLEYAVQVAMSRHWLMQAHPDRFSPAQLHEAATRYEALARKAWESGSPAGAYWYVVATREVAGALAVGWPEESLKIAGRGLSCYEENWPTDEALQEVRPIDFWPAMLRAHAAAGRWEAARRLGEATLAQIEKGDFASGDEGRIRADFSGVLEKLGAVDEARLQLGLAAAADPPRKKDLEDFQQRHPLGPSENEEFQDALAAARARISSGLEQRARRDLLATEVDLPTPEFQVKDLFGKKVSLASFRGKTIVLTLWATWCGACIWEMEQLEVTRRRYQDDPGVTFAAVNVDWEREKVAPFIQEKKFTLPIFIAEGGLEKDFGVDSIPKMFIIDPRGRTRFRLDDLLTEDRFQQSLDWMIDAAQKAPLPASAGEK